MQNKSNKLIALSAAAMVLNGFSSVAEANPPDGKTKVDYRYSSYKEDALPANKRAMGSDSRYSIDVHHAKIKLPVSEKTEVSTYIISETMSGASPYYVTEVDGTLLQVMSGATIDESRIEIGADFRSYHDQSETTLSASYSKENDYESLGFGYSSSWRFNDSLTTLNYGVSGSRDNIDASNADDDPQRPVNEHKTRLGFFAGISQVVTKTTLVSGTIGFTALDGYLSDTYKKAVVLGQFGGLQHDSRPSEQLQTSISLSLREYFPKANAALHADYAYYENDWELTSNTLDLGWYQNIGGGWQVIPSYRWYSQSEAIFYAPVYYAPRNDGYYSSDFRLSDFSSTSARIKLHKAWNKYRINLSYERYSSKGDHPGLVEFEHLGLAWGVDF